MKTKKVEKKIISAQLPMTFREEDIIRAYCKRNGATLGRIAVISMLEHIERDKR